MRPFISLLARRFRQHGWVANTPEGLTLAIEGDSELQQAMMVKIRSDLPPQARIFSMSAKRLPLTGFQDFLIKDSKVNGNASPFVQPDMAVCRHCIRDISDRGSRFYRYPFTSCSHCGPRYSIMTSQPYDRQRTAMARFKLCPDCARDYHSIDNRRFHAQTIACPACGPRLTLTDHTGSRLAENDAALSEAGLWLRKGKIIAVKGIGGYQLWVDAASPNAIERLRSSKHRPKKPFALMAADVPMAESLCHISDAELQGLTAAAAPIVLMRRKIDAAVAENVAPDSDRLGVMLACSPLHYLLLADFGAPVVATSGNRGNEPICIGNDQALNRLAGMADFFLMHDRPVLRPLDDSIVRQIGNQMTVLRRARGYAPLPIAMKKPLPDALAVGGHLKNTVAVCRDRHLILSPHIGDLDCDLSRQQMAAACSDLESFYRVSPKTLLRDRHETYGSSQYAEQRGKHFETSIRTVKIQHHYAHILACMAEHGLEPPLLGVAWDGNGLGSDPSLWGGEFLLIGQKGFSRFAHFRSFPLPGAAKAILEPRRSALGVLDELQLASEFDPKKLSFSETEWTLLRSALSKQFNCPRTTAVGRLFDAVAALLGLCPINQYEGQAAMILENDAFKTNAMEAYHFAIAGKAPLIVDWQAMIAAVLTDIGNGHAAVVARKFHNTLAQIIAALAERAALPTVVLSGGCFQNAVLTEAAIAQLKSAGFRVYCHSQIPPNDGGLALGQLYAAHFIE